MAKSLDDRLGEALANDTALLMAHIKELRTALEETLAGLEGIFTFLAQAPRGDYIERAEELLARPFILAPEKD